MRFMVIVKATADSEAGVMPSEQLLAEMGRYNEQLVQAPPHDVVAGLELRPLLPVLGRLDLRPQLGQFVTHLTDLGDAPLSIPEQRGVAPV